MFKCNTTLYKIVYLVWQLCGLTQTGFLVYPCFSVVAIISLKIAFKYARV